MPTSTIKWTVKNLLGWCENYLQSKEVDNPRLDAELLLAHALELDRIWLFTHPHEVIGKNHLAAFRELIQRRAQREPVAQILEYTHFFHEKYFVNSDVLVPRPESECLVEGTLERLKPNDHILDVGTGSGCLLLSTLKAFDAATGVGLDCSYAALQVARKNANELALQSRVAFLQADLLSSIKQESANLILANPPYVNQVDYETLMPEVRCYEPVLALDGGVDGYDVYRKILPQLVEKLKPGGACGLEVGQGQAQLVMALGSGAGLEYEETVLDYSRIPRVLWFRRAG